MPVKLLQADSGEEMFNKLDNSNVDLIVLDPGLPDEDGLVIAREIRIRSNISSIILTARQNKEDKIAGLAVDADDYLTISVNPEEFLLRIRNLIIRTQTNVKRSVKKKLKKVSDLRLGS